MKHISLIILLLSLCLSATFADGAGESCETQKEIYSVYTCRVEQTCGAYKSEKPSYKTQRFEKADLLEESYIWSLQNWQALGEAKEIYRNNIGTIYKCAIIGAQKNALEFLSKQLQNEKTWAIDDTIGRQIDQRANRLDLSANSLWCSFTEQEQFIIKENLLSEATYEACKYVNYLEYLRSYYSDTNNLLWTNNKNNNSDFQETYINTEIPELIGWIQASINQEIEQTYKVFPLVFHAYSEYENNFPIHFMLEVLHADFVLLRQKLYQVVMPIAQVGYKIINAMTL